MLRASELCFSYKKSEPLFKKLSLTLKSGKVYGLLGKNGVGKTTLFQNLAGLLFPDSGSCFFDGTPVLLRSVSVLQKMFYLPEACVLPALNPKTYENLYSCFYPHFDRDLFWQNIDIFEIASNKLLTRMSFGQQKKFILAFAFASGVKCYLLDEPTNGLDISSKEQFHSVLTKVLDQTKTFIISTHQSKELQDLIKTVLILEGGGIIFHQDWDVVKEKLVVVKTSSCLDQALFSQQKDDGWKCLLKADDMPSGCQALPVSFEFLYQAALSQPQVLCEAVGFLEETE